jgi:hypothetical protein
MPTTRSNFEIFNPPEFLQRESGRFSPLSVVAPLGALIFAAFGIGTAGVVLAQSPADAVPTEVSGELTVLYADDFSHQRNERLYQLNDKSNHRQFQLRFEGEPPTDLRTGSKIKVRGKAKDQVLYLAADGTANVQTITASTTTAVSGDQKTLVMVTNFTDATVSCAPGTIQNLLFTDPANQSVDMLYREMSLNQVSFSGIVAGPFSIDYSTASACNTSAWADAADAAAKASGIDLTQYARKVYVLPSNNSCGYSGLGQVGGIPSRAWVFRCDVADAYGHELGHNLGMGHAATLSYEYGDSSDLMGASGVGLRQINGPHREQMGWLPSDKIKLIAQGGNYDLAPIEVDPASAVAPQTVKIAKPDTAEYYYLSYRQPLGFDGSLTSGLVRGIAVHRYSGNGSAAKTYLLQTLADGQSFVDTVNGITVTQISHAAGYVTFNVQLNSGTCAPATPSVSFSPADQSSSAGTTLNYTVSVTNRDSASCAQSVFSLANTLPAGWLAAFSPNSLVLAPGVTGTATLAVTSAASAAAGTYTVQANVADIATTGHTAGTSGSYTVVAGCTRTPPMISFAPASQNGNAGTTLNYTVSVTNRDSANCTASSFSLARVIPSGWAGTLGSSALLLSPGATGTTMLAVTSATSAAAGTYAVQVNATDTTSASHAASGSGSYAVLAVQGDIQAPTAPTSLTGSVKGKQISLVWKAATDNVGVAGYTVWRNGIRLGNTSQLSYADKTMTRGAMYTYYVTAYDSAGNVSPASNSVNVSY